MAMKLRKELIQKKFDKFQSILGKRQMKRNQDKKSNKILQTRKKAFIIIGSVWCKACREEQKKSAILLS